MPIVTQNFHLINTSLGENLSPPSPQTSSLSNNLFTRQSSEDVLNVLSKENNSISRGKAEHITANVFEECVDMCGMGWRVGLYRVTQIYTKRKWRISNKNAKIKLGAAIKSPASTLRNINKNITKLEHYFNHLY